MLFSFEVLGEIIAYLSPNLTMNCCFSQGNILALMSYEAWHSINDRSDQLIGRIESGLRSYQEAVWDFSYYAFSWKFPKSSLGRIGNGVWWCDANGLNDSQVLLRPYSRLKFNSSREILDCNWGWPEKGGDECSSISDALNYWAIRFMAITEIN